MRIGVSTGCLYPMETEKSLSALLELGYRTFEIFLNSDGELEPGFLGELKRRADEQGASIVSIHPYTSAIEGMLLFGDYRRRVEDGMALYRRYLEAAALLGASYVVIHGQKEGGKLLSLRISDEEYWERFGRLYELGNSIGARPLQENVVGHRSGSPQFLRGMRKYLRDSCGFVLDFKQARCQGISLSEALDAMGDRLFHVHLSDGAPGVPCLLPGKGTQDLAAALQALSHRGYRGAAVTEVYSTCFTEISELERARLYMEKILGK